jgi:hypothetical protein
MPRFTVLLRGVNVGKGKRVPMAGFKRLLEELGYTDVRTLLNSGNAVFASAGRSGAKHALAIAAEVERRFGVLTPVIVKSAAEVVRGQARVAGEVVKLNHRENSPRRPRARRIKHAGVLPVSSPGRGFCRVGDSMRSARKPRQIVKGYRHR